MSQIFLLLFLLTLLSSSIYSQLNPASGPTSNVQSATIPQSDVSSLAVSSLTQFSQLFQTTTRPITNLFQTVSQAIDKMSSFFRAIRVFFECSVEPGATRRTFLQEMLYRSNPAVYVHLRPLAPWKVEIHLNLKTMTADQKLAVLKRVVAHNPVLARIQHSIETKGAVMTAIDIKRGKFLKPLTSKKISVSDRAVMAFRKNKKKVKRVVDRLRRKTQPEESVPPGGDVFDPNYAKT